MRMKYLFTSVLAVAYAVVAWGQQSVPPQTSPADSGPTLPATMQFIQEKLNERGRFGWVETTSNGLIHRDFIQLNDVMADPTTCTLYTTETEERTIELQKGRVLKPGGQLTADDMHTITVETDTISFKQVEKITAEKLQDLINQAYAESAHPEITVTEIPSVFYVKISASNAVFPIHNSTVKGAKAAVVNDTTSKINGFMFRDEESANQLAKAMIHAVELCGGGISPTLAASAQMPQSRSSDQPTPKMTNNEVIQLVTAGLSDQVVTNSIRQASNKDFDLAPTGLIALKKAGVSDTVIAVMQESGMPTSSPAAPNQITPAPRSEAPPEPPRTIETPPPSPCADIDYMGVIQAVTGGGMMAGSNAYGGRVRNRAPYTKDVDFAWVMNGREETGTFRIPGGQIIDVNLGVGSGPPTNVRVVDCR